MPPSSPDDRWPLSAPESLILAGGATGDTWALSLAILELAVRHHLTLRTLERRKLVVFRQHTLVLTGPITMSAVTSAPLRAV